MKCTRCGTQFDGKFCPNCGALGVTEAAAANTVPPAANPKNVKPVYKKWWFWLIIVIVALVVIGAVSGGGETPSNNDPDSSETQNGGDTTNNNEADTATKITVVDFSSMSKADIEAWASENKVTCEFSEEYSDTVAVGSVVSQSKNANDTVKEGATIKVVLSKGKKPSIEYLNALKKAETYSNVMHMSKKSIYRQLTSEYGEQFPEDAAQYAIDNLDADYKLNALEKAKSYQKNMNMSKSAIYDQLTSEYGERFTEEEAQYAIDHLED